MDIEDWIKWIFPYKSIQYIMIGLIIILIISGIIGNLPTLVPGPLSKSERRLKYQHSHIKFIKNIIFIISILGIFYLCLNLLIPIKEPLNLLLISRTLSTNNIKEKDKKILLKNYFNNKYRYIDIGILIDKIIYKIKDKIKNKILNTFSIRKEIKEYIISQFYSKRFWESLIYYNYNQLKEININLELKKYNKLYPFYKDIPKWIIESTEITLIQLVKEKYNIKKALVVAPSYKKIKGLKLACKILNLIYYPVDIKKSVFINFFNCKYYKDNNEIIIWYILRNNITIKDKTTIKDKIFILNESGERLYTKVCKINFTFNINKIKIKINNKIKKWKKLYVSDQYGEAYSRIDIIERNKKHKLKLFIINDTHREEWKKTFLEIENNNYFEAFKEELKIFHLELPIISNKDKDIDAYLLEKDKIIISNKKLNNKELELINNKEYFNNIESDIRIKKDIITLNTIYSWLNQCILRENLSEKINIPFSKVWISSYIEEDKKNNFNFIQSLCTKDKNIVIINIKPDKLNNFLINNKLNIKKYELIQTLALIKVISWTLKYVTGKYYYNSDIFSSNVSNQAIPLLSKTEIDNLVLGELKFKEFFTIIFIGIYIFFITYSIFKLY